MIELLTPVQLDEMRPAGKFVGEVLTALSDAADVGVNLLDLDALAHDRGGVAQPWTDRDDVRPCRVA